MYSLCHLSLRTLANNKIYIDIDVINISDIHNCCIVNNTSIAAEGGHLNV